MSNNTLKKPVMLPTASGYHPQPNNFISPSIPNSSESQTTQNPTVSVQYPQNVYFIYGNPTIPMAAAAPSQQVPSDYEQRFNILENRVSTLIEKFEQMLKAHQAETTKQRLTFGGNLFRPAAADCVNTQNRQQTLFGQVPQSNINFGFNTRSFERPFWFGEHNQNSFAKAKGLFEQQSTQHHQHAAQMLGHKPQCQMNIQNPNITKLMQSQKENNLDIIDGIVKSNGTYSLRDMSDDEEN